MNTPFEEKVMVRLDTVTSQLESINRSMAKLATKDELTKSIDDVAGAVKKGFDEVHEKFDEVHEKFDEVHEKIEGLEFKIDRMDTRFTNQLDYINVWYPSKSEFMQLDTRVKKIEKRMRMKA